jgi:hypothetical protein
MNLIPARWLLVLLALALVATAGCHDVTVGSTRSSKSKSAQTKADASKVKTAAAKPDQKADSAKPASAKPVPTDPVATWTIEGYGATVELASEHAITKTYKKLDAFLASLQPPVAWRPSADEVKQRFLQSEPTKNADAEDIPPIGDDNVHSWTWTVNVRPADVDYFRNEDNAYRVAVARKGREVVSQERMTWLAKLMALVVTCLCGVWGFLRFDEWVFGSRRNRLRLAVLGAIATGGLGWWLLS